MGFSPAKWRRAKTSLIMVTLGDCRVSVGAKSRPDKSGMPIDSKYRGVTIRYSVDGSDSFAIGGRPSIVNESVMLLPVSGKEDTAPAETTPGVFVVRSRICENAWVTCS